MEHSNIVNKWSTFRTFTLSIGVYRKQSPVKHLQICILCPCQCTPFYRPMLVLACLTGVTGLVANIGQWSSSICMSLY